MPRLIKIFLVVVCLIFSFNGICITSKPVQSENTIKMDVLPFTTRVVTNDQSCNDAIVNIYIKETFDFESDTNFIFQTVRTNKNGLLAFDIPRDVFYIIEITKKGFVHKRFAIDTKDLPDEAWAIGYPGFNIESVSLFKKLDGIDYKMFNYPLVLIEYNFENENFDYDVNYSNLALAAIDLIKNLEAKQKELNKYRIEYFELENLNKIIMFIYSLVLVGLIILIIVVIKRKSNSGSKA